MNEAKVPIDDGRVVRRDRPLRTLLDELGLNDYKPIGPGGLMSMDPGSEVFVVLEPAAEQSHQRVLLKERHSYLSDDEYRLQMELHRHLFRNGGPVVPLPEFAADRLPLMTPDGRLFGLQDWMEGRSLNADSLTDLAALADTLACFHLAAVDFNWTASSDVHKEPRDRFGKAEFYLSLLHNYFENPPDPLETRLYAALRYAGAQLDGLYDKTGPEPLQPIHGDPDPANALLLSHKCVLLDYDDAHLSTRAADLAWLLTLCAGLKPVAGPVALTFRSTWSKPHLEAIIESYQARARLDHAGTHALRWWLVAAVICVVVDNFHHNGWSLEPAALRREGRKALSLIEELKDIQLCLESPIKQ